MHEFAASLLREKFIVHELKSGAGRPVPTLSNRMACEHRNTADALEETLVVRARNMHVCVRLAAYLLNSFQRHGPLLKQVKAFDWAEAWRFAADGEERDDGAGLWAVVYSEGQPLFESGTRPSLLDVIEECQSRNAGAYENSIPLAENTLKDAGRPVKIVYEGHIALVASLERLQGRCGVILRGGGRTTTFNFTVAGRENLPLDFSRCLVAAAAFLEGLQLAYLIGTTQEKFKAALAPPADEAKIGDARLRLGRLRAEIAGFEEAWTVRYRPERPDFDEFILHAETAARQLMKRQQQR